MGFRITTWNVNGIRNPFGYHPWSVNRTYQAMFDTLEADIVVMQECKIQRKDLQDDMVLIPGWDVHFSLPKVKKGYSGGLLLRKEETSVVDFFSSPSRRFLNQLVYGGLVFQDRDEGREQPVLWDLCREFHPTRQGMYTCWEVKKNARPGNFGSRIDYVLCSTGIKSWVYNADIQHGLMGSDHCPVYATFSDIVKKDGQDFHLLDLLNPEAYEIYCVSLVTKKTGVNCGRSFYMCSRPLGPSGDKEIGTEFRCRTFIWSSDWSGRL
ncbi:hypothetical protein P8C59_009283 [Phyllachora maydis]|uniref:DNA-(apurinic or apyrimidinic site) endonuclease 2 n=1 Tax=Phyllachora maydis TaxID=1825666 RepID=A0AAD9ICU3_9PEZI|nr:hypothetical protein P8C59_009283 [Phyllachora maydis]